MRKLGGWLVLVLVAMITWVVVLRTCEVNCVALCTRNDAEINESQEISVIKKPMVTAKKKITAIKTKTYYDVPLDWELQDHIMKICEERNIDPAIVMGMIYVESKFTAGAIGDNGHSFGLMQVQPYWHSGRMKKLGVTDLLDPFQNVIVGIDYLDDLLDKYDGNYGKALTAYNRGHYSGTVTYYARAVLSFSDEIRF